MANFKSYSRRMDDAENVFEHQAKDMFPKYKQGGYNKKVLKQALTRTS